MSEENFLTWLAAFLEDNPRIQVQLKDHMLECDEELDHNIVDEAIDEFINSH